MVNYIIYKKTRIIIQLNPVSSMIKSRLENIKIPSVL